VTDGAKGREPRILGRPDHTISRSNIDDNALKVLHRLHRARRLGYMVGGAVRDLLLDRKPKDYDIATDARPPEVRRLFRNSRIIGRRFRLAHVYFKEGIVEVATFRRDPDPGAQQGADGELLITDDNVFGTPEEDAFRRDFTVNALFYNIADYSVIDYVDGIEDLRARRIRAIGDPHVRFQEDPVRMTRACELAGRLGFTIERETQRAIVEQRHEIRKASTARLTEELLQILRSGKAGDTLQWMLDLGLVEVFLPEAMAILEAEREGLGKWGEALTVLDRKAAEGKSLPDTAVMGCLLLPAILRARHLAERGRGGAIPADQLRAVVDDVVAPFYLRVGLSKVKAEQTALAVLALDRMERRGDWTQGERMRLGNRPYFADSLLYFELLTRAAGLDPQALQPWREVEKRHSHLDRGPGSARGAGPARAGSPEPAARPRRRRRPRRRGGRGGRRTE
jgi:poly(A) polymerase